MIFSQCIIVFMIYPHNLYIHVPFCISKCKYCAFYSSAVSPDWNKYKNDICNELKFWSGKIAKCSVPTIFFGGGTPSLMPIDVFTDIMNCIHENFVVDDNCEITIESNPGTLDKNKLFDFVSNGVNRLSVGVQSLDDNELEFLGRKHNVAQSLQLLETALNMNLRVSADFIYGLPNHNIQTVTKLCRDINALGLKHVSMYELTIEKNTPFGKMNLNMPDNDAMADMYVAIYENLKLPRYEVSNYAIPGEECRHNKNIWLGNPYIGIGRGAAGRPYIDNVWFDEMGNNERCEKISNETRAVEKIITGMRTVYGVMLDADIEKQLNFDWIETHKDLVVLSAKHLCATKKGMLLLDNIITDLIK